MELFGFDVNRLQVAGPQAFQDLGGVLSNSGVGEAAKTLWSPVAYFLPEVRIKPEARPALGPSGASVGLDSAQPALPLGLLALGAVALWIVWK